MHLDMYCMKEPEEWLDDIEKAKASGKGVTIIEVAERCQDPNSRGPNIRPSSPRSVEALLRSGIDPEDLVHKPLSFFKGRTGDVELAQGSYEFFEEGRQKRIEEVKTLRQTLIDDGWTAGAAAAGPSKTSDDSGAADLVERERKRLEVLRNRQQRELDQLVEYEVKRAQIHAKAEAKLAKQEARAKELFEAKQAKEKAWREALRNQELKRLAAEKEEEEKIKIADKERFQREQEFLAKEKQKESEARAEAYRKEQERIAKAEAARQETERILEAQQKLVEARKRDMAARDAEREAKKLEKQKILAEENEEKRKLAAERLAAAYAANVALLEKKRQDFNQREKESALRREAQAREREAAELAKQAMSQAKAEKRKDVYQQSVKQQQDRVNSILKKAAEQDASMERERERRNKELSRRKLVRQLNTEYRMECVDTSRKQQLYSRETLLNKIKTQTDRVLQMRREAASLQIQRKEANMQAAMQRQKMVETMDRLQQANKFHKIASGEATLNSLM
eukprot:jgi/Ulvmu1/11808/UM080_0019.1